MQAKKSISHIFCVVLAVIFMLLLAPGHQAHAAAALTVNTLADNETEDGFCTLREAITAANNNANYNGCTATGYGDDTITFNLSGTIVLGSWLPGVTATAAGGALTIDGVGQTITISGNNSVSVISVLTDATLTLQNLTVTNADSIAGGGGVWSTGTLTVTNCIFSNNHALQGGGISAVGGTLTVINSSFSGNSATSMSGGGIYNNGTLTVTNSTFSGNNASGGGGIDNSGSLTVSNSTFSGNSATVNNGGGINNGGTLTITNSTLNGNSATANKGGGIYNNGTLTVINSTFYGNSAKVDKAGGVYNNSIATLRNTIIANNTTGGNCKGPITNDGINIDDGTTCGWGSSNGSMSSTNPLLGVLANNGGPT